MGEIYDVKGSFTAVWKQNAYIYVHSGT